MSDVYGIGLSESLGLDLGLMIHGVHSECSRKWEASDQGYGWWRRVSSRTYILYLGEVQSQ